ncbi:MAG: hypothetical protein ACR2J8_05355 [Thermomicrobiales bacterium]
MMTWAPVAIHAADPGKPFRWAGTHPSLPFLAKIDDSAGLAAWPGGFISVVREQLSDWPVVAVHRFVEFDADLRMRRISHPFVFRGQGDERCGGIVVADGMVELSLYAERAVWFAGVPVEEVNRLLLSLSVIMMVEPGGPGAGQTGGRHGAAGTVSLAGRARELDTIAGRALRAVM